MTDGVKNRPLNSSIPTPKHPDIVNRFYKKMSKEKIIAAYEALADNYNRLIEHKPTPEFEQYDARHFKELNEFPSFICIRAVRRLL